MDFVLIFLAFDVLIPNNLSKRLFQFEHFCAIFGNINKLPSFTNFQHNFCTTKVCKCKWQKYDIFTRQNTPHYGHKIVPHFYTTKFSISTHFSLISFQLQMWSAISLTLSPCTVKISASTTVDSRSCFTTHLSKQFTS
jgi:hypothetical protein